jgi:hypothetical protein
VLGSAWFCGLLEGLLDTRTLGALSEASHFHQSCLSEALLARPYEFVYNADYGSFGLGPLSRLEAHEGAYDQEKLDHEHDEEDCCVPDIPRFFEPNVAERHRLAKFVKRWPAENSKLRFGAVAAWFRNCVHISSYDGWRATS